jgi:hypothetical protein
MLEISVPCLIAPAGVELLQGIRPLQVAQSYLLGLVEESSKVPPSSDIGYKYTLW